MPERIAMSLAALAACVSLGALGADPPPMLTGEVLSRQAQQINVPQTNNWQSRITKLVPEGAHVEAGEVVVEFDGTEAARQLEQQRETARTEQARTERDIAQLEKELAQASFQLEQARVTLELATLKAEIPAGMIGAIEHAENQLALEQSTKALENARAQHEDKRKLLAERTEGAALDLRKLELQERWWAQMLDSFMVRAEQSGYVIYSNHPWTRAKFQEGDNVQTSFHVAQVADTSDLAIRVWINGVDRPRLDAGDRVSVRLDALPGREFAGHIEDLSESGSKRQEWGWADYFEAVVALDEDASDVLLPGMSALVEVL
jgi:multidrug resistance efflux pump